MSIAADASSSSAIMTLKIKDFPLIIICMPKRHLEQADSILKFDVDFRHFNIGAVQPAAQAVAIGLKRESETCTCDHGVGVEYFG
jgi:hypothetical protein